MPKSSLFPSLPQVNRIVKLEGDAIFASSMLGALIKLDGNDLQIAPLPVAFSGLIYLTGEGTVSGDIEEVLDSETVLIFAFVNEQILSLSAPASAIPGLADILDSKQNVNPAITVADSAARKFAGSYADGQLQVGSLKVKQIDLPGVLWFLIAADVTQDASWFAVVGRDEQMPRIWNTTTESWYRLTVSGNSENEIMHVVPE